MYVCMYVCMYVFVCGVFGTHIRTYYYSLYLHYVLYKCDVRTYVVLCVQYILSIV